MSLTPRANTSGLSPTVGIILMVAVTVVLSAVIGGFALGIHDRQSSEPPQPGLDVSGNHVSVVTMGTAETLHIYDDAGNELATLEETGDEYEFTQTGKFTVIGTVDNSRTVVRTIKVEADDL